MSYSTAVNRNLHVGLFPLLWTENYMSHFHCCEQKSTCLISTAVNRNLHVLFPLLWTEIYVLFPLLWTEIYMSYFHCCEQKSHVSFPMQWSEIYMSHFQFSEQKSTCLISSIVNRNLHVSISMSVEDHKIGQSVPLSPGNGSKCPWGHGE